MPEKLPHPLVAVADLSLFGGETAGLVEAAVRGGVRWALLRAKDIPREELLKCASTLRERCPGLFISIHGDAEVRSSLELPGLHLPSGRMRSFRACEGGKILLGVSCHSLEEALGAVEDGADYGFLSPLFEPSSKRGFLEPLGVEGFREIVVRSSLPLYALGGITADNMEEAFFAGAAGVAVCGALFNSANVEEAAKKLVGSAEKVFI
ncbi:thiamine phosphate synthase [bacterium]|nr:MAG: thiamine phosphate synthase [bacterium]